MGLFNLQCTSRALPAHLEALQKLWAFNDPLLSCHGAHIDNAASLRHEGQNCLTHILGTNKIGVQGLSGLACSKDVSLESYACTMSAMAWQH